MYEMRMKVKGQSWTPWEPLGFTPTDSIVNFLTETVHKITFHCSYGVKVQYRKVKP